MDGGTPAVSTIIADGPIVLSDLGIDANRDLWCGQRVRPDGDIAKSVPLAGTPRTEICEHPAKYLIGEPCVVEVEKEVIDDDLELTTVTRERNQLAVLSCGVHKERAVEHFEAHRPDDGGGLPRAASLAEGEV
jgi:hypothetical protein